MAAAAGVTATAVASNAPAARPTLRRISAEEAFNIPEIVQASGRFYAQGGAAREPGGPALREGFGAAIGARWFEQLVDLDQGRIAAMDEAGIATQILLLSGPGVQIFDPEPATELAALANDRSAEAMRRHPGRFFGLAAVAPQAPQAAALELQRSVRRLGLRGALINSHTSGEYLDDRKFWPILEAAEALQVPIYLHPREPAPAMLEPFRAHALVGPIWGFAAETSLHALRMIMAGVFDTFPRLQMILGHLGEGIPFFLDRIDIRYREDGSPQRVALRRLPSEYFRSNFTLTTSGMNWEPSVRQCITVMGMDRVMFAADWPFENAAAAVQAVENMRLSRNERRQLFQTNAERVFRLNS